MGEVIGMAIAAGAAITSEIIRANRAKKQNKRALEEQRKLMREQQALNIDTWEKTGAYAQREQLKKAGLNAGLLYSSGANGTLGSGSASVPQKADEAIDAGMAVQAGLQGARQKAEVENIEANTEKQKAETEKLETVDTEETKGRIGKLNWETHNAELNAGILEYEKEMKKIETDVASQTKDFKVQQEWSATDKVIGEAKTAQAKGEIDMQTRDKLIEQIKQNTVEQSLRIELQKQGIKVEQAKLEKITQEILAIGRELDQKDKQILLDEIRTEFGAGDEARTIRWIETTGKQLERIGDLVTKGKGKAANIPTPKQGNPLWK